MFGIRGQIWSRRIKGFWTEFKHKKVGLVGLGFILIYVFIAISAPWLTPYDPIKGRGVADGFAMPQWMTIFAAYRRLPPTIEPPIDWITSESSNAIKVTKSARNDLLVEYNGTGEHSVSFTTLFLYPYAPPNRFKVTFLWSAENVTNARYSLELLMTNPVGANFSLWSFPSEQFTSLNKTRIPVTFYSRNASIIFIEEGEYKLLLKIRFISESNGAAKIRFEDAKFKIFGLVHGILGTDSVGRDIFSQLIHGARISLAIGLFSAFLSTTIGISVGILAGYLGGKVDEALMRIVDILLCLPVLPLLLALIVMYGTSVWYLVLLIALFGWLGLSRLIRSVVLSLKEMPFVESARAAGASRLYIMTRHMLPNVIPVALAALVLAIPSAILTEAAISFIGLGDPTYPTWGRMLHYAFRQAGFRYLAWWWIIPPGLAITILTISFVFIGHAVDEIVNPRLRRRR
jgi:peptide/nickel transport system permease protein